VTKVVQTLLYANIIAFFLQTLLPGFYYATVFVPYLTLYRPWTLVTYMFLHGGLMHLAFNMLGLYFFGSAVETRMGPRRFQMLYFLGGISGALLQVAMSAGLGAIRGVPSGLNVPLVGASAGVFAIGLAFARFWPDTVIMVWGIIPVPARILVIITTVMAIWNGFSPGGGGNVAHFAHLGGYLGAWLYLIWWERGRADFKKRAVSASPDAVKKVDAWEQIDLARIHEVNRDEVRRLMEKAGKDGIGALSPEELRFLSNFVPTQDVVPPKT